MANIDPTASNSKFVMDTIIEMVQQNKWPYDMMLCDGNLYNRIGIYFNNQEWGKEYLVDFKDKAWFVDAHKDKFFNNDINTDVFSGMAPGAFIEGVYHIMYVSSEVENRLGIKVKNYDMNMSDYTSYAKAVYEYNQLNSDKITFAIFPWDYATRFFTHAVISVLEMDSPRSRSESINALKLVYQQFETLSKYRPIERYTTLQNERELLQSKVLFYYHASWINDIWIKNNPEGEKLMHPCEIPNIDNKTSSYYPGMYNCVFVVPQKAQNREAAELLMQFISSKDKAELWTKYSKSPTGLKVRISDSEFGSDEYAKFSQQIKDKYNDKLIAVSLGMLLFNTPKRLEFQVEKVLRGEITANQALGNLMKQIEGI
jgi:ABC-type glycerol-3-phosphate transport system substrate-binding protein